MRLRWILIPLGVLVLVGAVVAYFTLLPPALADDYEQKAEPEQHEIEDVLRPVRRSFDFPTFTAPYPSPRISPRVYLRRYRRSAAKVGRHRARARRLIARAERALDRVDRAAMTGPPSWPLIGGRGDLREAERAARQVDAYLRKADAFLRDYKRLLDYTATASTIFDRANFAAARADIAVRESQLTVEGYTRTIRRLVQTRVRGLNRLRRTKPPPEVRALHRGDVADLEASIATDRALIAAAERGDTAGADAIIDRAARTAEARSHKTADQLTQLVLESRFTRRIRDLERREDAIFQAFEDL